MSKIHVHNLTLSRQHVDDPDLEVEVEPRLHPPEDPTDWPELKRIVLEAVRDIPCNSHVLVDGMGQFTALVQDLEQYRMLFAVHDPESKQIVDVAPFQPFTPAERYAAGIALARRNGNGR